MELSAIIQQYTYASNIYSNVARKFAELVSLSQHFNMPSSIIQKYQQYQYFYQGLSDTYSNIAKAFANIQNLPNVTDANSAQQRARAYSQSAQIINNAISTLNYTCSQVGQLCSQLNAQSQQGPQSLISQLQQIQSQFNSLSRFYSLLATEYFGQIVPELQAGWNGKITQSDISSLSTKISDFCSKISNLASSASQQLCENLTVQESALYVFYRAQSYIRDAQATKDPEQQAQDYANASKSMQTVATLLSSLNLDTSQIEATAQVLNIVSQLLSIQDEVNSAMQNVSDQLQQLIPKTNWTPQAVENNDKKIASVAYNGVNQLTQAQNELQNLRTQLQNLQNSVQNQSLQNQINNLLTQIDNLINAYNEQKNKLLDIYNNASNQAMQIQLELSNPLSSIVAYLDSAVVAIGNTINKGLQDLQNFIQSKVPGILGQILSGVVIGALFALAQLIPIVDVAVDVAGAVSLVTSLASGLEEEYLSGVNGLNLFIDLGKSFLSPSSLATLITGIVLALTIHTFRAPEIDTDIGIKTVDTTLSDVDSNIKVDIGKLDTDISTNIGDALSKIEKSFESLGDILNRIKSKLSIPDTEIKNDIDVNSEIDNALNDIHIIAEKEISPSGDILKVSSINIGNTPVGGNVDISVNAEIGKITAETGKYTLGLSNGGFKLETPSGVLINLENGEFAEQIGGSLQEINMGEQLTEGGKVEPTLSKTEFQISNESLSKITPSESNAFTNYTGATSQLFKDIDNITPELNKINVVLNDATKVQNVFSEAKQAFDQMSIENGIELPKSVGDQLTIKIQNIGSELNSALEEYRDLVNRAGQDKLELENVLQKMEQLKGQNVSPDVLSSLEAQAKSIMDDINSIKDQVNSLKASINNIKNESTDLIERVHDLANNTQLLDGIKVADRLGLDISDPIKSYLDGKISLSELNQSVINDIMNEMPSLKADFETILKERGASSDIITRFDKYFDLLTQEIQTKQVPLSELSDLVNFMDNLESSNIDLTNVPANTFIQALEESRMDLLKTEPLNNILNSGGEPSTSVVTQLYSIADKYPELSNALGKVIDDVTQNHTILNSQRVSDFGNIADILEELKSKGISDETIANLAEKYLSGEISLDSLKAEATGLLNNSIALSNVSTPESQGSTVNSGSGGQAVLLQQPQTEESAIKIKTDITDEVKSIISSKSSELQFLSRFNPDVVTELTDELKAEIQSGKLTSLDQIKTFVDDFINKEFDNVKQTYDIFSNLSLQDAIKLTEDLNQVEGLISSGKISEAIQTLDSVKSQLPSDISSEIDKYETALKLVKDIESKLKISDVTGVIKDLNELRDLYPELSDELSSLLSDVNDYETVMTDLTNIRSAVDSMGSSELVQTIKDLKAGNLKALSFDLNTDLNTLQDVFQNPLSKIKLAEILVNKIGEDTTIDVKTKLSLVANVLASLGISTIMLPSIGTISIKQLVSLGSQNYTEQNIQNLINNIDNYLTTYYISNVLSSLTSPSILGSIGLVTPNIQPITGSTSSTTQINNISGTQTGVNTRITGNGQGTEVQPGVETTVLPPPQTAPPTAPLPPPPTPPSGSSQTPPLPPGGSNSGGSSVGQTATQIQGKQQRQVFVF